MASDSSRWGIGDWGAFGWGLTWEDGGGSTSGGILVAAHQRLISGGSQSSGDMEPSYGETGSTSGGLANIALTRAIAGGSTSGGIMAGTHTQGISGGSQSSGTADLETILAKAFATCLVMNLDTQRTFNYTNYGFVGFGRFKDVFLGAKTDGIYDLQTAATRDSDTKIAAFMETGTPDFGIDNRKGFRSILIEGGKGKITITNEEGRTVVKDIPQDRVTGVDLGFKSRRFKIRVDNINGEQITVNRLLAELSTLGKKGD